MSKKDKIGTLIQFSVKAGKAAIGRSACERLRKKNKLYLLILAKDASPHLTKFVQDTPSLYYSTRSGLGKLIGRDYVGIIGIGDLQFAQSIYKHVPPDDNINLPQSFFKH